MKPNRNNPVTLILGWIVGKLLGPRPLRDLDRPDPSALGGYSNDEIDILAEPKR